MKALVIGVGRVGYDFGLEKREQPASHFHCYQKLGAEIAVCDSNVDKLQSIYYNDDVRGWSKVADIMMHFQPEIVSICTPTGTHSEIAREVAKHDCVKGIMLEKPIADSLQEADNIIKACKDKNIRLSVNFTRRWDLMYTRLAPYGNFNSIIGVHPGPLVRTGVHMLDLFNMMMTKGNPPVGVQAFGSAKGNYITYPMSEKGDWNINGCVTYKNGEECTLISGKHIPKSVLFEVDMFTDTSRIRITENGDKVEEFLLDKSTRYTGLQELQFMRSLTRRGWYKTTPLLEAIKELCSGDSPSCSGEDARLALNVALALHDSATHDNKKVYLSSVPLDYTVRSY